MRSREIWIIVAVAVTGMLGPAEAQAPAQLPHTWVASFGSNANTCERSSPCATFLGALNKTLAGGEISCVDAGNFGGAVISQSLTINCENTVGTNTPGPSNGTTFFSVQLTSSSDTVLLRGLDISGLGGACSTCAPITFFGRGTLQIEKVRIGNLHGNSLGSTYGISFFPIGPARLEVSDSFIANIGAGGQIGGAGIYVFPASGGSANVSVNRTELKGNVNGIFVDAGSSGAGPVNLNVRDSLVTGSSNAGIAVASPSVPVTAVIDRTTVNSSLNTGVAASGAGAIVRVGNSTISGNVTGVAVFNGATMRSYKNNQINANLTDGTPLPAEGLN
jgi:hypothetical protein